MRLEVVLRKGFSQSIGSLISSTNWKDLDVAILHVFAKVMMTHVDMLLRGRNSLTRSLIGLSSPIDQMKINDDNHCNNYVSKERCKRITMSSVFANVGDDQASPQAAECNAHGFRPNAKFHVFRKMGNKHPYNSIDMLKRDEWLLI
jgi:hypothetical protein